MKEYIEKILEGQDLSVVEMKEAMLNIMSGEVDPILTASFLTALKHKKETVDEIVAGAMVMREKAAVIQIDDEVTLDTCGTGGDQQGTINISTATAILVAAAGVKVVKHGNRSVSSKCGCADVLEELGVRIDLNAEQVKECVEKINIGFLFAPTFHNAMKHVAPVRKALGFRTIFNILGPLANPANANYQLVGVFDESLLSVYANALKDLGVRRAMVVHGKDGLDEITITGRTLVMELRDGEIQEYEICPEDFGLKSAPMDAIRGGDKEENAQILKEIFQGKQGPMRDVILLNAGAALYVTDQVSSIAKGVEKAIELIDSGAVSRKLEEFIQLSKSLAEI